MASRLLPLLLLAACARTTLSSSVADTVEPADAASELDFWDALTEVRAVSNRDALAALGAVFGVEGDHAARVAEARERGWIGADENPPPLETARVGWIARAVCIEAKVPGGLTMRLFGPRERYAVRELNYRRWLPDLTPAQAISGLQLIALVSRFEEGGRR